jgi:hypothetical protein
VTSTQTQLNSELLAQVEFIEESFERVTSRVHGPHPLTHNTLNRLDALDQFIRDHNFCRADLDSQLSRIVQEGVQTWHVWVDLHIEQVEAFIERLPASPVDLFGEQTAAKLTEVSLFWKGQRNKALCIKHVLNETDLQDVNTTFHLNPLQRDREATVVDAFRWLLSDLPYHLHEEFVESATSICDQVEKVVTRYSGRIQGYAARRLSLERLLDRDRVEGSGDDWWARQSRISSAEEMEAPGTFGRKFVFELLRQLRQDREEMQNRPHSFEYYQGATAACCDVLTNAFTRLVFLVVSEDGSRELLKAVSLLEANPGTLSAEGTKRIRELIEDHCDMVSVNTMGDTREQEKLPQLIDSLRCALRAEDTSSRRTVGATNLSPLAELSFALAVVLDSDKFLGTRPLSHYR